MENYLGSAKISQKNQILIPSTIMEELNLKKEDIIIFKRDSKGNIVVKRGKVIENGK
jgi:AbrB family looped-hinge helix DNA binding protein